MHAPRLGSYYRICSFIASGLQFEGNRVLDIGSRDGILFDVVKSQVCVGVDLIPVRTNARIIMVQADGRRLPFQSGCFDQVFALDVIEHVPDDRQLVQEMLRVVRPEGKIFLSVPSSSIQIFPNFLTSLISISWGHYWRRGYAKEELISLIGEDKSTKVTCLDWNAPAYRLCYLPLRLLWSLSPKLARPIVMKIAQWDAEHSRGHNGFYWMLADRSGGV